MGGVVGQIVRCVFWWRLGAGLTRFGRFVSSGGAHDGCCSLQTMRQRAAGAGPLRRNAHPLSALPNDQSTSRASFNRCSQEGYIGREAGNGPRGAGDFARRLQDLRETDPRQGRAFHRRTRSRLPPALLSRTGWRCPRRCLPHLPQAVPDCQGTSQGRRRLPLPPHVLPAGARTSETCRQSEQLEDGFFARS